MKVLVCGGRLFSDGRLLNRALDALHELVSITEIIEGNARGADRLAGLWAKQNNIKNTKFRALWEVYGKAAGPIRNQQMLDEGKPDLVLAFPGQRGTADMVARAKRANIKVIGFDENDVPRELLYSFVESVEDDALLRGGAKRSS